jgi:large subunit ribosomal protein L11
MGKEKIKALIPGGKATASPPLGPALGPLGVNIGQVIAKINEQTGSFQGMQVPVTVIVDSDTKEFEIEVGTPPTASLILKEAGVEKGAGNSKTDKVADVLIQQVIKIAKMKESALLGKDMKQKVKEVIGTCNSMGILVEGVPAAEAITLVNDGKFDKEIREEQTELTEEQKKALEEEKKRLKAEMEERRAEFEATAKSIINEMKGQERNKIKAKLVEALIPNEIIEELLPAEEAAPAEGEAKPAEGEKKEAAPAAKK